MVQTIDITIRELEKLENKSTKERYIGDATEYAFRRHTLVLLKKLNSTNVDQLLKENKSFKKRIDKLEFDLNHYIKNYPEEINQNTEAQPKKQ